MRKADGSMEPFQEWKLERSLIRSGASEQVARTIVEDVTNTLTDGVTTERIYRNAFRLLKQRARGIAPHYHLKRALGELGPSGYPFEDYVARVFEGLGYTTLTRQTVRGACVLHEVDLIAERDGECLGAEIKFHNSTGLKSDLKVALYVKARFDDLAAHTENGGEKRFSSYWIITNTKFTEQAIAYANCAGLTLLSWNYPRDENLETMIIRTQAHPLTCLTTLSTAHKRALLVQGVVLCGELREKPHLLSNIGVRDSARARVYHEVDQLCATPLAR